ncbi:glycosyltransferase [Synechocystis sp. LKSZ1]|uniref:glycosyltransferase n=1 Tax=Synechocystis sp. LKSZ1 TaxID=3144951 RepID=UPI00336BE2A1
MQKKVLFAIPSIDQRGPDRVFFELISNFDRSKYKCVLAVQEASGYYLKHLPEDVKCHVIDSSNPKQTKYPIAELRSIIREEKPDVIVSTLRMIVTATFARMLMPKAPVHIIRPANHLTLDGLSLIRQSPLKHTASFLVNILTLWLSNFVICQSKSLQEDLSKYAPLKHKSAVINNPIDIESVREKAQAEKIPRWGDPSILAIGRLFPQKGFDLLLRSLPKVIEQYPHAHVTVLGEGPQRPELESLITKNNLEGHVSLPGFCANPYPHILACDFLVSTSRYEGFPNVILEATSLGKPVLATNCPGGTSEIVIPNLSGWLIQTENVLAISEGIKMAISEFGIINSQEIINFCYEYFDTQKIINKYDYFLEELLVN